MKIALIGASGFTGTPLLSELLNRGHQVTAIVRNPAKITTENPNLKVIAADVNNTGALTPLLSGHDAVLSAFSAGITDENLYNDFLAGSRSIQQAAKDAGVPRLLVIGGAGSLYIKPGVQLVDTPEFPAQWKTGAAAARDYYEELKKENGLDWTFLSPAIMLHPGTRTAQFRLGTDEPVFDAAGKSEISVEDLAVALADELEKKQFIRKRFTLGY
ncbi:NAD(P)-dependent oxidoreductase [Deminuibacter soli]|uniref:NAD(P)-dependent oxidoreductase n=1 Tax=Deminuibacter soli TaxID=2291815 RepID=A0A3E1NEK3_9BACT|nr:NAD(P)-dependent oxidoreductase [Deminuibacter soli]RFM26307.1 NAD(P)-dependent oxidoreductase [Deminuibacter soli]